jgi:hypothetical protein
MLPTPLEIAIVRHHRNPPNVREIKMASGSGAKLRIYDNYQVKCILLRSCLVKTAKTENGIAAIWKDLKSTQSEVGKGTIVHTTSNEKEVVPQPTTQSSLDVEVKMQPFKTLSLLRHQWFTT